VLGFVAGHARRLESEGVPLVAGKVRLRGR
jgi:hypothetical protein